MKVSIIQPCIPKYRVSFYENLSKEIDLNVIACPYDMDGLPSESGLNFKNRKNLKEIFILGRRFVIQKELFKSDLFSTDIWVVTGNPRYISNVALYIISRILRKKIVWWGQGWSANTNKITYSIKLFFSFFFDACIFYTDKEVEHAKKSFFCNKNIIGLNNGLDIDCIDKAISNISLKSVSPSDKLELVYIGRLTEKSNIEFLLNTIKFLNVNLTVIGSGTDFEDICDRYKEYNNINFKGAIYDESELADILVNMDVFIYGGAVGLSLIHAFAYSLPAIVHSSIDEHMPEISAFKDEVNGFSFSKNDSDSLVSVINKVSKIKKGDLLKQFKLNARLTVENNYTTKTMASKFAKIMKEL